MSKFIMRVGIIQPGKDMVVRDMRNSRDTFNRLVGGEVSEMKLDGGLVVLYDEDSKAKGRGFNMRIGGNDLYGNVIMVRDGGNKWLPLEKDDYLIDLRKVA
jgi:hypothetical protein